MAMFVLVVDTSLMNVSISAIVQDLNMTVSGVQSAIALEALVSAAFILIGGKIGDLYGRKRAYVLGLLGYAVGAVAMIFAQGLAALIVFWAIIGGLGASLLLPCHAVARPRQLRWRRAHASVRPGRRRGSHRHRRRTPAGRVHHHLSLMARGLPPRGRLDRDRAVRHSPGARRAVYGTTPGGCSSERVLSVLGMGGIVLGILVWQEGGERVALLLALGATFACGPGLLAAGAQAPR